ncbi:MAG: hypothetical protein HYW47_04655 [Deltaproteobacteria bacterium]|nr:hypothetical protein [Deltaproteobacteria bacterium]
MKKFLGVFIVLLFASSAFATVIVTEESMVTAPPGGSATLNHVWAKNLALRSGKLMMDVTVEWEIWRHPSYPNPRYHTEFVDLEFPEVTYNKATKELAFRGRRIGTVREKCHWYGCSRRIYLDYQYQLNAFSDGVGSMVDVSGELILFDNQ